MLAALWHSKVCTPMGDQLSVRPSPTCKYSLELKGCMTISEVKTFVSANSWDCNEAKQQC
jgi:hypothetical protein